MSPKLTSTIMSRRRLAAAIQQQLPYGAMRPLAAQLGIHEARVGRALRKPDEFTNDFELVAKSFGFERSANDGFYKRMAEVAA